MSNSIKAGQIYRRIALLSQELEVVAVGKHNDPWKHFDSVDMEPVAIYQNVEDNSYWVRPEDEFQDGRFEKVE